MQQQSQYSQIEVRVGSSDDKMVVLKIGDAEPIYMPPRIALILAKEMFDIATELSQGTKQ